MSETLYIFALSSAADEDPLDGKLVSSTPPGSDTHAAGQPIPLSRFSGQYWFVELAGGEHEALSTEEIAARLGDRTAARALGGPFSTRDEAARSLERYWEMLTDDVDA